MRIRGVKQALAGACAALVVAAPAASAQEPGDRDCFWQGGNGATNIAYPDRGATYWVSAFPLPPGFELILRGRYPHARYMSFNVYDAALQPTDGLPDVDIDPDQGSTNPFESGARRDRAKRDYTLRVVAGVPPAEREPNTVYLNAAGTASFAGVIIYRVYVPDSGLERDGGVGLPEVSLRLPTGEELDQPLVCAQRDATASELADDLHANTDGPNTPAPEPGAEDPIRWEAFFNYAQAFSYPLQSTPAAAARDIVPRDSAGGFLSNVDNAYTLALASRGIGPILQLRGKAPTTPRTEQGQTRMGKGQVRYWSICQNEFASQRVIDCAYDQQVPLNDRRRYRVVVSTPAERPENARRACGVTWLRWGAQPEGLVLLRHMLPSVTFAQAIQNVAQAGTEEEVVGKYLPRGHHMTRADFEAKGC